MNFGQPNDKINSAIMGPRELLLLFLVCAIQRTARSSNSNGDSDSDCDFSYSNDQVPHVFHEGDQYPSRGEETECQPIRLHVRPGTRRYHDMVTYYGDYVHFSSPYRRMTSRMHTRLAKLASHYYDLYGEVLYVLKTWSDYPDIDTDVHNSSLHYEGTSLILINTN